MEYEIRKATAVDAAAIRKLIREGGINPFGLHWSRFRVAVAPGGEIIGCGQVKPHRDGSRELASIAVRRPYRRRGVARAIIQSLQNDHPAPLWLTCLHTLAPFYTQFGFHEMHDPAQMPPYYRRAQHFIRLLFRLRRTDGYLAVMRWTDSISPLGTQRTTETTERKIKRTLWPLSFLCVPSYHAPRNHSYPRQIRKHRKRTRVNF
jgi:N-acetylglutamate synthase-like GNAT family acetyltransferase